MKTLESIVPSPSLCRKISVWRFEDSALVWIFDHNKAKKFYPETPADYRFFCVEQRKIFEAEVTAGIKFRDYEIYESNRPPMYPAPTLAEIMSELDEPTLWFKNKKWLCAGRGYLIAMTAETASDAALRLWLKLKGEEL